MGAEFDLEWFCGELVGMTTRARVMESIRIGSTCTYVRGFTLIRTATASGLGLTGRRCGGTRIIGAAIAIPLEF
jgi:hypothetical protein